jgi:SARP family transcriptional regulator, regulator of embCAB operon
VVRISVTGRLTVENGGAFLQERDVPGNQGRLALTMLIVEHKHPVSRDQLAEELWPDGLPRSWETALRAVVSKVRAAIGRAGLDPRMIDSAFGCYQLRLAGASIDFEAAVAALHTAEDQLRRGEYLAAAVSATVTCIVCRRPFLRGLYNPWTVEQRERLHDMHVTARQILAEAHAAVGDWTRSAQHAQRGVELDPYREALHQHLILARGRAGDRIGAAHVFHRYRTLMRDEFGVEPTHQTVAILDEALSQA